MSYPTAQSAVEAAKPVLKNLTPLKTNCGQYCNAACCEGEEDVGMLLFADEEKQYQNCAWATVRWQILFCNGVCPRNERPLSCRIFPLIPVIDTTGDEPRVKAVIDRRSFAMCPLVRQGVLALQKAFVEAVEEAGRILYQHPQTRAQLEKFTEEQHMLASLL